MTLYPRRDAGDRARRPQKPTFVDVLPKPHIVFDTAADLAAYVQKRRGKAGLQLRPQVAAWHGSDTFPILEAHLLHPDEDQGEYFGALFLNGMSRQAFEDLVREAEPKAARTKLDKAKAPTSILVLA